MKKIFKLFLTLVLAISLTGCVKYHVNMEVGEDKEVTLKIIYAMEADESLMEGFDEDAGWEVDEENIELEEGVEGKVTDGEGNVIYDSTEDDEDDSLTDENYDEEYEEESDSWTDEEYEDENDSLIDEGDENTSSSVNKEDYKFLEEKGFKVEEFTEEKDDSTISGVKITKTYKNIDDITKDKKIVVDFNERFSEEGTFDDSQYFYKNGDKYVANFVFDFSEEGDTTDYSAYQDMFDLEYKIKLPTKSSSNNATSVSEDGKELTWNLKYGEKNEVNFEFSLDKSNSTLLIVLVVCGVVIIGGITIGIIVSKNKKNKPVIQPNNFQ